MSFGIDFLRQLVRQQTVSIGEPVSNLFGAVAPVAPVVSVERDLDWLVLSIPGGRIRGLGEFFAAYWMHPDRQISVVPAPSGAIVIGENIQVVGESGLVPQSKTYLVRGVVDTPGPIVVPLALLAKDFSGEFAVYVDGVLQRRATEKLSITLGIDAGSHMIDIVATSVLFGVSVPPSIRIRGVQDSLIAPQWESVVVGYADPQSGSSAVTLTWYNESRVGGWILRRREFTDLGAIANVTAVDDERNFGVEITGDHTESITLGQELFSGRQFMGIVLYVDYDVDGDVTTVRLRLADHREDVSLFWSTRSAAIGQFVELARIKRMSASLTVTWMDMQVAIGRSYEYGLQAFSAVSEQILGPMSELEYVRAGDTFPPGAITFLQTPSVQDGTVTVKFKAPIEDDYAGVRVVYQDEQVEGLSSGSNTATTLNDTSQVWITDEWIDFLVIITSGTGVGQIRAIVSNTGTQLVVDKSWGTVIPDATSEYLIFTFKESLVHYGHPDIEDELRFIPSTYGPYFFIAFDWAGNTQDFGQAAVWVYSISHDRESGTAPRTTVVIDERTPDGAVSTTVVRLWFQMEPAPILQDSGTSSGANDAYTLNDTTKSWVADQWKSVGNTYYFVRIVDGLGKGQMRSIVGNTGTQLVVGAAWGTIPDSTSLYSIVDGGTQYRRNDGNFIPVFEPEFITRGIDGDTIEYFSVINEIPKETIRRVFIDGDTEPRIDSITLAENDPNELEVSLDGMDDDVKLWLLYARRGMIAASDSGTSSGTNGANTLNDTSKAWTANQFTGYAVAITGGPGNGQVRTIQSNTTTQVVVEENWTSVPDGTSTYAIFQSQWPTASGSRTDTSFQDKYLKGEFPPYQTSVSFSAGGTGANDGLWYVMAVPMNSYNDLGFAASKVALVDGVADNEAALSGLSVGPNDDGTTAYYNKIGWSHNTHTDVTKGVLIFAYRSDQGPLTQVDLTGGVHRDPRKDVGSDFVNSDDTDNVSDVGSFLHQVGKRVASGQGVLLEWRYTVKLFRDIGGTPVLVTTYQVNHSDYYEGPVPVFSGTASTVKISDGSSTTTEGCTSPLTNRVSWGIQSGTQNDAEYRIDIDRSGQQTPTIYSSLVQGLSTNDIRFDHEKWGSVFDATGLDQFDTYKVKIVRKSDSAIIDSQITNTLTTPSIACLL